MKENYEEETVEKEEEFEKKKIHMQKICSKSIWK